jgi:hypothetical protein
VKSGDGLAKEGGDGGENKSHIAFSRFFFFWLQTKYENNFSKKKKHPSIFLASFLNHV